MNDYIMLTKGQYNDLINKAEKLEKYEKYLREQSCRTCKYFKLPQSKEEQQICSGCFNNSEWKFRGDTE